SDMLIKEEDPAKIVFGSTLSEYGFPGELRFDFMLTNPPYGTSWADDKKTLGIGPKGAILDTRFQVGTSRINDGQLMFVLHMLSKMKETELGSRIASVHNGSALFTGDAGAGESEIRRYLLENDLLEAIIALPNDIFYNTGIPTYILLMTNRKAAHRRGKVQLINANGEQFFGKMRKSLGSKRNELRRPHIDKVMQLFLDFKPTEHSQIFDTTDFGYAQITVQRPERDAKGQIVKDKQGRPKADKSRKDIENIPLKEDIQAFFAREVLPFAPDAWWEAADTRIGYEINFNKYFYRYTPPRPLAEIAADLLAIEKETENLLLQIVQA
ncbi:MAG: N-6 DNA methylase, partial [Saprospiraceae bacterium]